MRSKKPSIQEQQAVKAILERERLAQASDASTIESLARDGATSGEFVDEEELLDLAALDLDDPNWMSQVSAKQLERFHRVLASGALDDVLHPWVPWWYRDTLSPKITVIQNETQEVHPEEEPDEALEPSPSPSIIDIIPTLASLTKIKPSPLLANNVLEVLYAYAYTKRLLNGDWEEENALEAVEMVISLSEVLRENAVHKDLKDACRRPMEASLRDAENRVSGLFTTSVLEDARKIISHGPSFVMAALSELHDLFLVTSRDESRPTQKQPSNDVKKVPTLSQMQKKLLFFIVWANECSKDVLPSVEVGINHIISESEQLSSTPAMTQKEEDSRFIVTAPTVSPSSPSSTKVKRTPKIVELS